MCVVVGYVARRAGQGRATGYVAIEAVEAVGQAVEGLQTVEAWGVQFAAHSAEAVHDVGLCHTSLQAVRQAARQAVEAVGPCVVCGLQVTALLSTVEHAARCASALCESMQGQAVCVALDGRTVVLRDTESHEGAAVERVAHCLALALDGCAWATACA